MNKSTALFTTALLLFAGAAHAQEVVAVPSGVDTIIPIKKGQVAPMDGQLFDNPTSLRWANWLVQYKGMVANNKELDQAVCKAQTDLDVTKLVNLQAQYDAVTKDLQAKLTAAQNEAANPAWYNTRTFGIGVGVVFTVVVVGIAAYAVHQ